MTSPDIQSVFARLEDHIGAVPRARSSGSVVPMPDLPANEPRPNRAIFLRPMLKVDEAGRIDFLYEEIAYAKLNSEEHIAEFVERYHSNKSLIPWKQPQETILGKSKLSIRARVSTYVVFVLDKNSWRFSSKTGHFPFQVEAKYVDQFFEARYLWYDGGVAHGTTPPDDLDIVAAYFILHRPVGVPSPKPRERMSFNIYIDLIDTGFIGARYIPIVVDPDVGHPGGSYHADDPDI